MSFFYLRFSGNRTHALGIALLVLALFDQALTLPLLGQQGVLNGTHTYINSDRSFKFEYPDFLVQCHRSEKNNWEPSESCEAMLTVCEDGELLCFGYPAERLAGLNLLAAAFSIGPPGQTRSERECFVSIEEAGSSSKGHVELINGMKFQVREWVDAAMSHSRDTYVYATYHRRRCYAMVITFSFVSAGSFDPDGAPKELTETQRAAIKQTLMQPIKTFQFLK